MGALIKICEQLLTFKIGPYLGKINVMIHAATFFRIISFQVSSIAANKQENKQNCVKFSKSARYSKFIIQVLIYCTKK